MSTFKLKPDKIRHSIDVRTLDESHRKIMNEFQKRRESLPAKKLKLQKLIDKLEKIEQKDKGDYTTTDIKDRSTIKSDIKDLHDEIHDIENNISEIEYYSKTDDLLMDYYEIIEHADSMLYNDNPELCEEKDVVQTESAEYDALDVLNQMKKTNKRNKKVTKRRKRRVINDKSNSITTYFGIDMQDEDKEQNDKSRAEIYDQYKIITDGEYHSEKIKNSRELKKCLECDKEMTINHTEGISVCEECGSFEMMISESEKPNYKDSNVPEKPGYPCWSFMWMRVILC